MGDKIKKRCPNISCSTFNIPVETDKTECIACSNNLVPDTGEMFRKLFGDSFGDRFDDLFGKK